MRLIDADKVNKTIDRFIGYLDEDMILRIKMKISAIPTVELAHGEWIPCAERLPERDKIVLVLFKTGRVHPCKYLDDGSENPWWSYIDDCCAWNNTVIAWMPLPTPYKEEGEKK